MKIFRILFVGAVLLSLSCATSLQKNIENCLFSLDGSNWSAAITECTKAVNSDPQSEDATVLLSAAYAGQGGVDILGLQKELSEETNEDEAFKAVHTSLVASIGADGLSDLRTSITTLTDFTAAGYTVVDTENFFGQLGMLQAIESFGLPTITAQPVSGGAITPTDITEANKGNVQTDFIEADSYLVDYAGWGADHQLVKALRKNYHVLQDVTAGTGFTLGELQDLTLCQLTPTDERDDLTPADFQEVTSCADFDFDGASDSTPNTL